MSQDLNSYVPAFLEELKYTSGSITSLVAIKKFQTYIEQIVEGKLTADSIKDWNYYISKYLKPFKLSCFKPFLDILLDAIINPKTRLILLGDLLYFFDYILQTKEQEYITYASTRVLEVTQWIFYRVLYQQLLADYASSQGVSVDITKLSEQLVKFDKVINRWNNPKPSKATPHIQPQPVFDATTLASLQSTRSELLYQYNSRLHNQQNQIRECSTHQQANSNLHYHQSQQSQQSSSVAPNTTSNPNNNIPYQQQPYQIEQWSYGGYADDLIELLHEEILGTKFTAKTKKSSETEPTPDAVLHIQRFPAQPPPCYMTDQFRLFQPSVYQALCEPPNSRTCRTCGLIFLETELTLYQNHIKYHVHRAQYKLTMKEGLDKRNFDNRARLPLFDQSDFIHFRHATDQVEYRLSAIQAQAQQSQLFRQYTQNMQNNINNPMALPSTHLSDQYRELEEQALLHPAIHNARSSYDDNDSASEDDDNPLYSLKHGDADELYNEDGSLNEATLPFYDPRDGFSSLDESRHPKAENFKTNSTTTCAICDDLFQTSYNSNRDNWVLQNCVYITHDLILQACLSHIIFLKKGKFKLALRNTDLSKLNILQPKDGEKATKFVFTDLQRMELSKRLESFVSTKALGSQQRLVHYSPCFKNILKESRKYEY